MRPQSAVKFVLAAVFLSAVGLPTAFATEVAFVEEVSGHVVALLQGKPTLLGALDTINHRTQLDLSPNSEVRLCHYQAGKIVSLKGPLRVTVSRDGVTVASGAKAAPATVGPCAAPVASTFQGGVVTRGVSEQPPVKDVPRKR